jgi:hypothetical protein
VNLTTTIRIAGTAIVLFTAAILSYSLFQKRHAAELADRIIDADLQSIELAHRSAPLGGPIFLLGGGGAAGDVIGVPTDSREFPNAWLAATTRRSDGSFYAVIPPGAHLRVSCAGIDRLGARAAMTRGLAAPVRDYLQKNCVAASDSQTR